MTRHRLIPKTRQCIYLWKEIVDQFPKQDGTTIYMNKSKINSRNRTRKLYFFLYGHMKINSRNRTGRLSLSPSDMNSRNKTCLPTKTDRRLTPEIGWGNYLSFFMVRWRSINETGGGDYLYHQAVWTPETGRFYQ